MRLTKLLLITLFTSVIVISSCKKETEKQDAQLFFNFSHSVGSEDLEFDTIKYTNTAANKYSISTLKYFISSISLTKSDGSIYVFEGAHYVDAFDPSTTTYKLPNLAPAGEYQSLSFIFGLNEELNISGAFPNQPESNMEWSLPMGGGYHYMKLEGKFDSTDLVKNYQAHFGRLMENSHFFEITLSNISLSVDGLAITFNIKMDINKWWETPNNLDLNNMSGIMGNETIQQQLEQNGTDVFSYMLEKID